MKIIDVVELQEIDIPLDSFLDGNALLKIRDDVKKYFDIEYKPKSDSLKLVAGGGIGLIPLNDDFAINVKPKFPISNLVYLISKSGDEINTLDFFNRDYKKLSEKSSDLFIFFASSLNNELKKVYDEGVYKNYILLTYSTSSPKGRINFRKTLQKKWPRGDYSKIVIDNFVFRSDTPLNRLIKFTIWFCLNKLSLLHRNEISLISSLSYYYEIFNSVPIDYKQNFIFEVDQILRDKKIPQLRYYYVNLLKLCRIIIDDITISFSSHGLDINLQSFRMDISVTFEKYILNVLREGKDSVGKFVNILDGNTDGKKSLFIDKDNPPAKPDYIIQINGVNKILIDAKYKLKIKEIDRYQIIAHCISYDVRTAILLSPSTDYKDPGLYFIGTIGNQYNLKVYEYAFNLDCDDFPNEEAKFLKALSKLCVSA